jgi:excisionase family DNA binding protein
MDTTDRQLGTGAALVSGMDTETAAVLRSVVAELVAATGRLQAELDRLAATPPPARVVSPTLLTIEEAAGALALGRSTVCELIASGELGSVRIGRSRRIPVSAVDAFVTERAG